MQNEPTDYRGEIKPVWCPGCGGYAILSAVLKALSKMGIKPTELVLAGGIGCGSRLPGYVKCLRLHTIHGRALPIAMGVKLANPKLKVIAASGDGDGITIGGNHFIHAAKRNVELVYIMMDNGIFGMTKGQPSSTSPYGLITRASPHGVAERPFDPVALALVCGASFVARGFSGRPQELAEAVERAMEHKGFAFVHVLSPCPTFYNTYELHRNKVNKIEEHDTTDRSAALRLATDSEGYPLGVYLDVKEETFDERIHSFETHKEKDIKGLFEKFL